MARFKIVTPAGPGTGARDYSLEMEALAPIGAEIVEVSGGEDELIKPLPSTPTRSTPRAGRVSPPR